MRAGGPLPVRSLHAKRAKACDRSSIFVWTSPVEPARRRRRRRRESYRIPPHFIASRNRIAALRQSATHLFALQVLHRQRIAQRMGQCRHPSALHMRIRRPKGPQCGRGIHWHPYAQGKLLTVTYPATLRRDYIDEKRRKKLREI